VIFGDKEGIVVLGHSHHGSQVVVDGEEWTLPPPWEVGVNIVHDPTADEGEGMTGLEVEVTA
jgi:hypothetical protein